MQTISEKVKDLELARTSLRSQSRISTAGSINGSELLLRLKRTVDNLKKLPVADRRPIYSNLIKFAELHPTKIRLEVYAPTASISNLSSLAANRAGSCAVSNGARRPTVEEPLALAQEYPIQWREPRFNHAELAKLRMRKN